MLNSNIIILNTNFRGKDSGKETQRRQFYESLGKRMPMKKSKRVKDEVKEESPVSQTPETSDQSKSPKTQTEANKRKISTDNDQEKDLKIRL